MNAYLRAAAKHPKVKAQAEERLGRRKGLRPDRPNINRPVGPGNGRPDRRPIN